MSCKYPKTSRSYKFCYGCDSMYACNDSSITGEKGEKEEIQTKPFLVERTDRYSYCNDYAAVVMSTDELHAENFARMNISDFKKAELRVTEVKTDEESVVLVANTGA